MIDDKILIGEGRKKTGAIGDASSLIADFRVNRSGAADLQALHIIPSVNDLRSIRIRADTNENWRREQCGDIAAILRAAACIARFSIMFGNVGNVDGEEINCSASTIQLRRRF